MIAHTPEQMRALANMAEALAYHDQARHVSDSAAALRAAADQLEAVQAWLDGQDSAEWDVVDLEALDVILRGGDND